MSKDSRNYGNEYVDFWKMMSKKLIKDFNSETLYRQLTKEITMKQKASKALETVMLEEIVKEMNLSEDMVSYNDRNDRNDIFWKRYTFDYDVCYGTEEEVIYEVCCVLRKAIGNNKLRKLNMMFNGNSFYYSVFVEPLKSDSQHDHEKKVCSMMMPQIYDALDLSDVRIDYIGTIKHAGDVVGMMVDDEPANRLGQRKLHGMQIREIIVLVGPPCGKVHKMVSEIVDIIREKFPNKWKYFAGNFVYDENMKSRLFCYQVEEELK